MKQTTLLLAAIMLSICSYSQKKSKFAVDGDSFTFNKSEVQALLKENSDTLEIVGKKIRFIKVDGKVYEIVRTTTLKEVGNGFSFISGFGSPTPYYLKDTASTLRFNPLKP